MNRLLGALVLPALVCPAQTRGTSASCTMSIPTRLSPGFSIATSTGTYGTAGEAGTMICFGSVDGDRVTGPGTFGFEGTYTGDCFGNTGSGTYSFTVPTEAGPKRFTGSYTEQRTGFSGPVEASQSDGDFRGVFVVLPQEGDCISSPVTGVVINIAGTFGPSSINPERRTSPSP